MLRTITMGSCVTIQGLFVKALEDGRIAVRVGEMLYIGRAVPTCARAA